MTVKDAAFALRVVRRREGDAAILYRRTLTAKRMERLTSSEIQERYRGFRKLTHFED